eukprot:RCo019729
MTSSYGAASSTYPSSTSSPVTTSPPAEVGLLPSPEELAEACTIASSQPTTVLVLVVHGMGSTAEGIAAHQSELAEIREQVFTVLPSQLRNDLRVEFRCIDWLSPVRSELSLMQETMKMVTPPAIPASAVLTPFVDVMLYLTYHQDSILRATRQELNSAYWRYCSFFPDLMDTRRLQVVIVAHSLGSVICYDLLSLTALDFPVLAMYCVGSPLGLFHAVRCHSPGSLPKVYPIEDTGSSYFYNVLYAYDPFAYRFEPFVDAGLASLPAVPIPPWPAPPNFVSGLFTRPKPAASPLATTTTSMSSPPVVQVQSNREQPSSERFLSILPPTSAERPVSSSSPA